jgi:hypothetical protein
VATVATKAHLNKAYLTTLAATTLDLDANGDIVRVYGPVSSKVSKGGKVAVHLPRTDTSFARRETVVVEGSLACHYAMGEGADPAIVTITSDVAEALTCPACREAFDTAVTEINAERQRSRLTTGLPLERRTAAVDKIMALAAADRDVHRVLKDAVRTHGLTAEGQLNLEALYEALYPRSRRDA